MNSIFDYASELVATAGRKMISGQVFAKVLTKNDDSGRHGVHIANDAYHFFPTFDIPCVTENATMRFSGFNANARKPVSLAYKYYERYPERRVTCLDGLLNDRTATHRMLVFVRAVHDDNSVGYYFDCTNSNVCVRFNELFGLIFGSSVCPEPGTFVVREIKSAPFVADAVLNDLLARFDQVNAKGWIDSLREGDTGIGYTFETEIGIKENNDQKADFHGIEIKCKGLKESGGTLSSKINLFQAGPTWVTRHSAKERIRQIGKLEDDGLYSCFSQLTVTPNNLRLLLDVLPTEQRIDLKKDTEQLGYWAFERLLRRLIQKHSRTAFIKARIQRTKTKTRYSYEEFIYCDQPSMERFIELVAARNIVFEFTMSEKSGGEVRNHGYPWRLIRSEFMDSLFGFQIRLR